MHGIVLWISLPTGRLCIKSLTFKLTSCIQQFLSYWVLRDMNSLTCPTRWNHRLYKNTLLKCVPLTNFRASHSPKNTGVSTEAAANEREDGLWRHAVSTWRNTIQTRFTKLFILTIMITVLMLREFTAFRRLKKQNKNNRNNIHMCTHVRHCIDQKCRLCNGVSALYYIEKERKQKQIADVSVNLTQWAPRNPLSI